MEREGGWRESVLATQGQTLAATSLRFARGKLSSEVGNHSTTLEELEAVDFL